MAKRSAGLVMYRVAESRLEVLLVHPGGPLWAKKDLGAWSIPKGEYDETEQAIEAAIREFEEETSFRAIGPFLDLGSAKQSSGKVVSAWAFAGDCDPSQLVSNLVCMEWPPKSGRRIEFPEVDRASWFTIRAARERILKGQAVFLQSLEDEMRAIEIRGTPS